MTTPTIIVNEKIYEQNTQENVDADEQTIITETVNEEQQNIQAQVDNTKLSTLTTFAIYFNTMVDIVFDENGNYKFIAKKEIAPGSLIFIEHPLQCNNLDDITSLILFDKKLYDTLYPRHEKLSSSVLQKENEEVLGNYLADKVYKNVYTGVDTPKEYMLGNLLSKINHSCKPNCLSNHVDRIKVENEEEIFGGVWSIKRILKGQELTIDYAAESFGEKHLDVLKHHDIKCTCPQDLTEKAWKKKYQVICNLRQNFNAKNDLYIQFMISAYACSPQFKRIMTARKRILEIVIQHEQEEEEAEKQEEKKPDEQQQQDGQQEEKQQDV